MATPAPMSCAKCGDNSVWLQIEGLGPLCRRHSGEWLSGEAQAGAEAQVRRIMEALDRVSDEPVGGDWDAHLRKMALAAIGAM